MEKQYTLSEFIHTVDKKKDIQKQSSTDRMQFAYTPESFVSQEQPRPIEYELKMIAASLDSSLDESQTGFGSVPNHGMYVPNSSSLFNGVGTNNYNPNLTPAPSINSSPYSPYNSNAPSSAGTSPTITRAKKYFCNYPDCGKGFTTVGHLVRHSKIHSGDKEFACPWEGCAKQFSRQDNMRQHYKTHLRVKKNRRGLSHNAKLSSTNSTPTMSSRTQNRSGNIYDFENQQLVHSTPATPYWGYTSGDSSISPSVDNSITVQRKIALSENSSPMFNSDLTQYSPYNSSALSVAQLQSQLLKDREELLDEFSVRDTYSQPN